MFPRMDLYYTDPAQYLTTVGEELDDLDHDLICPRCAKFCLFHRPREKATAKQHEQDHAAPASYVRLLAWKFRLQP